MAEQLKYMFNAAFISELAHELNHYDAKFDAHNFIESIINSEWDELELKARANKIADQMFVFLPYRYEQQVEIIERVAPHFSGFKGIIFPTFVERHGIEYPEISIPALKKLTPHSSSEFAIRPFLINDPSLMKTLLSWSKDPNYHVRRLASEGCRPLLPWAPKIQRFIDDPGPILPILDQLKNDPEDYVYRSVANNLNDISKHHPNLVLELCDKWISQSKTTQWVVKHGLRTLLKRGNQQAMQLFGFGDSSSLSIENFALKNTSLNIGEATHFSLRAKNKGEEAKFRLEYSIGFVKKNGTLSEKVFQIRELNLKSNETLSLDKKIDFKNLSTRKHYPGEHFIRLKINGIEHNKINFILND